MATKNDKAEIIRPPNTLQVKLGGGSGIAIDADAITRAERAVDGLKCEFSSWLTQDIATLSSSFATFAKDRNSNNAGALYRAAHDLKGQATTFEYPLVARIAASLAKLMQGLRSLEAAPLPLVEAHVNAIHVIHRDRIKDISNLVALTLAEELEGRVINTLERDSLRP
jgi:chemotaxis protein histidine kinase CheA